MDFTITALTDKGREALKKCEAAAIETRKARLLVKVRRLDDKSINIAPAGLKMFPNSLKENKQMIATLGAGLKSMMEEYGCTEEDYNFK